MIRRRDMCVDEVQGPTKRKRKNSFPDSRKFFPSPPDTLSRLYQSSSSSSSDESDCRIGIPEQATTKRKYISYMTYFDEKPVFGDDVEGDDICNLEHVDIVDLLSDNGRRDYLVNKNGDHVAVGTLKGKYVLLCCFFVPVHNSSSEPSICQAINAAHAELSACGITDFKVVVVAKMRAFWDKKVVFKHFLSGFLDDTLAVPFSDSESRESLCKSLGMNAVTPNPCVLVDRQGCVLQKDAGYLFHSYGAEFYPFTDSHLEEVSTRTSLLKLRLDATYRKTNEDDCQTIVDDGVKQGNSRRSLKRLLRRRVSLEELLECDSFSKIGDEKESASVESLSQQHVGVYLCRDGGLMDKLNEVHQQCVSDGREFVVVLVCVAFDENVSSFFNQVKLAMEKRNITSWWLCPFNDKISRRLWRLSDYPSTDQLIIVPPKKTGELHGKQVISTFGLDYYPFTRETVIEKKLSKLKSITLKSLLKKSKHLVRNGSTDPVPVADLRGRKVLLYIDYVEVRYIDEDFYNMLRDLYPDIKAKHPRSEVVFVPLDKLDFEDKRVREMPWLILPSSSDSVAKKLFRDFGESAHARLVTFGEDGQILSRQANEGLDDDGVDATGLFDDMLQQETDAEFATMSDDEEY